ncbi:MAG TPA: hypothetical protein VLS49_01065 [Usitatibacter sp.]|nr:hypothetical protein [Usitatibacter sp.]
MPELRFRPLTPADQSFLWDIFHLALWDPPPAPLRPRSLLEHPEVRIYAENWGRDGDVAALEAARARYRKASLSVHPQNPAARLYARCGFVDVGVCRTYRVMVWTADGA